MGSVLSNEELDALKTAFNDGSVSTRDRDTARVEARKLAKPYDFSSNAALSARPRALFQALHDRYARALSRLFSRILNNSIHVKVSEIEAQTFGSVSERIESGGVLITLKLEALEGNALMAVHPKLGFAIVDLMMGGSGEAEAPERPFTEIELEVLDEATAPMVTELQSVLTRVQESKVEVEERVVNRQLLRFVPEDETVVSVVLEIRVKELTGLVTLCYANKAVEAISSLVSVAEDQQRAGGPTVLGPEGVAQVPLNAHVFLDPVQLSIREVMLLRSGDVLLFDHPVSHPMDLKVGERPICQGHLGAHGDRTTFAVSRRH